MWKREDGPVVDPIFPAAQFPLRSQIAYGDDVMARVTVVIPAYNPGSFLEIALRSLLAQTFESWEAVVVDDGSEEDISGVTELDGRIRLIRQENRGLTAARNTAIARSDSEFVAFLDADDVWLPRKLERQIETLTASADAALCSTDFERINVDGSHFGDSYIGSRDSFLELLTGNGICVSTVVVRRGALDDVGVFSERYAQVQDWHLWLRLAQHHQLVHVPEVLVQYRVHAAQMSVNYERYFQESRQILDEYQGSDPRASAAIKQGMALVNAVAGAQAFDAFRASRNPRHFFCAIRLAPRLVLRQLKLFVLRR
jgi:glycosyltransferase involved in cell wall biosynthesis